MKSRSTSLRLCRTCSGVTGREPMTPPDPLQRPIGFVAANDKDKDKDKKG